MSQNTSCLLIYNYRWRLSFYRFWIRILLAVMDPDSDMYDIQILLRFSRPTNRIRPRILLDPAPLGLVVTVHHFTAARVAINQTKTFTRQIIGGINRGLCTYLRGSAESSRDADPGTVITPLKIYRRHRNFFLFARFSISVFSEELSKISFLTSGFY